MHAAGTYACGRAAGTRQRGLPMPQFHHHAPTRRASASEAIQAKHASCVPAPIGPRSRFRDGGVARANPLATAAALSDTVRAAGACALSLLIMMIVTSTISPSFRAITILYAIPPPPPSPPHPFLRHDPTMDTAAGDSRWAAGEAAAAPGTLRSVRSYL
ncbi:hypothetical protein B0H15DRAFT_1025531 [Mycena belliarum]|uniref:Uncharacterized protein n=1 Tax=Mycena belliarum TaxID=1033014 RepID=A0AAD6TW23_9AGAR|nr:hypothetical protein B0H15DRAFT_1025531 [Mycena belliae]